MGYSRYIPVLIILVLFAVVKAEMTEGLFTAGHMKAHNLLILSLASGILKQRAGLAESNSDCEGPHPLAHDENFQLPLQRLQLSLAPPLLPLRSHFL